MMETTGPSLRKARDLVGGRMVSTALQEMGGRGHGAVPSLPSASHPLRIPGLCPGRLLSERLSY